MSLAVDGNQIHEITHAYQMGTLGLVEFCGRGELFPGRG